MKQHLKPLTEYCKKNISGFTNFESIDFIPQDNEGNIDSIEIKAFAIHSKMLMGLIKYCKKNIISFYVLTTYKSNTITFRII